MYMDIGERLYLERHGHVYVVHFLCHYTYKIPTPTLSHWSISFWKERKAVIARLYN